MYTLKDAIRQAKNEAELKFNQGNLIESDLWNDDIHSDNCETVYSIISMYADDENNDGTWEIKIRSELEKLYPTYF